MKSRLLILALFALFHCTQKKSSVRFSIAFTKEMAEQAQDGRLLIMLANNDKSEPRMQISDGLKTQLIFGVDVEGMKPGEEIIIDENAFGFPIRSVSGIPKGEYFIQALINRYETFHLTSGHTVKLPPDQGEGQHWNTKPYNFYSKPQKISIDPEKSETFKVVMDQKIEPL